MNLLFSIYFSTPICFISIHFSHIFHIWKKGKLMPYISYMEKREIDVPVLTLEGKNCTTVPNYSQFPLYTGHWVHISHIEKKQIDVPVLTLEGKEQSVPMKRSSQYFNFNFNFFSKGKNKACLWRGRASLRPWNAILESCPAYMARIHTYMTRIHTYEPVCGLGTPF